MRFFLGESFSGDSGVKGRAILGLVEVGDAFEGIGNPGRLQKEVFGDLRRRPLASSHPFWRPGPWVAAARVCFKRPSFFQGAFDLYEHFNL